MTDEPLVIDFRKDDDVPRVDVFEKVRTDPDYAMTVWDYIQRQHPDEVLDRIKESTVVTIVGTVYPPEPEMEVEWA